jgi:hypothetical protein
MPPVLTIAVPTYNRLDFLKDTVLPIISSGVLSSRLQLHVLDNASTDGTGEWLKTLRGTHGLVVTRHSFNRGLEGNLIEALMTSEGDFIWLLSDHMSVFCEGLNDLVEHLSRASSAGLKIAYARIRSYGAIREHAYEPAAWSSFSPTETSRFLFRTGNISGLIVSQALRTKASRSICRFAGFSYPHLGVFAHIDESDIVMETEFLSDFQPAAMTKKFQPSYNGFRSRFIGYPDAVRAIQRINPAVRANNVGLTQVVGPLKRDSIDLLTADGVASGLEFWQPLKDFPARAKPFLLLCHALSYLPNALRRDISRLVFGRPLRPINPPENTASHLRVVE